MQYEGGERCGVCGHVLHGDAGSTEELSAMPTQILPGFLYMGSFDHASRLELLKAMGITHILSLVPTCQELYKNTLTYHTVQATPADFKECFDCIDEVRTAQQRILVHCMTGTGKSPAVVMGYLMKLRGWTLKESYVWVKDRHKSTELSQGDAQRLQALEVSFMGSSSTGFPSSLQLCAGQPVAPEASRSSGPFAISWLANATPITAPAWDLQTSTPALAFSRSGDQNQFVFGSRNTSVQPDSTQAAMDV